MADPPSNNDNIMTSNAADLDRQTEACLQEIETEVKQQPLTSERKLIETLRDLYDPATQTEFLQGCDYLATQYSHYRSIRGDGNCYYRAFLFRLIEVLLALPPKDPEGMRILEWIRTASWQQVIQTGYSEFAVETFYDQVVEVLQDVVVDRNKTADDWTTELNEENAVSDYCTWYLRVLTATYLKSAPDRFLPFMEEQHLDMQQYCAREIEPMGKECEMVSVLALAEAFGVQVSVEYLDGRALLGTNKKLARHTFGPDNARLSIEVLYRPGHYGAYECDCVCVLESCELLLYE
eukprot:scaffold2256_cov166-Amphora_coffeaeformis.AAC.16